MLKLQNPRELYGGRIKSAYIEIASEYVTRLWVHFDIPTIVSDDFIAKSELGAKQMFAKYYGKGAKWLECK
jgi:hypothetical protein